MQVFKHFFALFLIVFSQVIYSQEEENTKEKEQSILVGFGPTLELSESLYGINSRFYYGINEAFCFGPEVSYFPYQDIDNGIETAIIDLNVNAHYIFELNKKMGLYPLSGINYTIEKERLIEDNDESEQEEAFGINYGVGIHYTFNNLFIFSEFKGVLGQLNAEFITVGVIFNFKLPSKK